MPDRIPAEAKIACLGDSITYGFPFGPSASWVHLAGQAIGLNFINRGENGDTTGDLLYRWPGEVAPLRPDAVIIMGGTNDAAIGISAEKVSKNIMLLVARSLSIKSRPILALPIPSGDHWLEKNMALIRQDIALIAENNRLSIIDFTPAMAREGKIITEHFIDDVHPSAKGYRAMAEIVENTFGDFDFITQWGRFKWS